MVLLAMAASYSYLAGFLMSLSRSLYCLAEAMDLASKRISRLSKKAPMDWPMVSVPSKVGRSIIVTRVFLADQGSFVYTKYKFKWIFCLSMEYPCNAHQI